MMDGILREVADALLVAAGRLLAAGCMPSDSGILSNTTQAAVPDSQVSTKPKQQAFRRWTLDAIPCSISVGVGDAAGADGGPPFHVPQTEAPAAACRSVGGRAGLHGLVLQLSQGSCLN